LPQAFERRAYRLEADDCPLEADSSQHLSELSEVGSSINQAVYAQGSQNV
jgi:hypothetical protein